MAGKRVRLTADARRTQLVDEATALIARIGYHRFSITALAEATGLTRAGVLHHVGSKEQLLLDVLAGRDERDMAAMRLASTRPAREVLDAVVRRNLAQPEIVRLYTVLAAESLDPDHPAHVFFAHRLSAGTSQMATLLDGFDRPALQVAIEVYAFMDGLQLNWLRDPSIDLWHRWNSYADALFAARSRPPPVRPEPAPQ